MKHIMLRLSAMALILTAFPALSQAASAPDAQTQTPAPAREAAPVARGVISNSAPINLHGNRSVMRPVAPPVAPSVARGSATQNRPATQTRPALVARPDPNASSPTSGLAASQAIRGASHSSAQNYNSRLQKQATRAGNKIRSPFPESFSGGMSLNTPADTKTVQTQAAPVRDPLRPATSSAAQNTQGAASRTPYIVDTQANSRGGKADVQRQGNSAYHAPVDLKVQRYQGLSRITRN